MELKKYFDHKLGSAIAGVVFAIAWFLLIDGFSYHASTFERASWYYYIPPTVSTIILILINLVSLDDLDPELSLWGDGIATKVKIYLFVFVILGMGSIVGAFVICFTTHFYWMQISIVVNTSLVYFSAVLLLLVRKTPKDDDSIMM